MSGYLCPDCGQKSHVVDSRTSGIRLRRRRKCDGQGHKFSTIEVGLDAREKIKSLMEWVTTVRWMDEDTHFYINEQIDHIMLGTPLSDPED